MKRRGILVLVIVFIAICVTGCGKLVNDAQANFQTVSDNADYLKSDGVHVSSNMDYSNTYIDGDLADYSYDFTADGDLDSKEVALDEYEKLQSMAIERGGKVSSVSNYYWANDDDTDGDFCDWDDIRHKANGSIKFTVEVSNEYIQEFIDELEKFTDEHGLTVKNYRQVITNYKDVKVADSGKDNDYYGYHVYTQEELDNMLKYADLDVYITYDVPSSFGRSFKFVMSNLWWLVKYFVLSWLIMIVVGCAIVYSIAALIILPAYKIVHRGIVEDREKHPELYKPRRVIVIEEPDVLYKTPGDQGENDE